MQHELILTKLSCTAQADALQLWRLMLATHCAPGAKIAWKTFQVGVFMRLSLVISVCHQSAFNISELQTCQSCTVCESDWFQQCSWPLLILFFIRKASAAANEGILGLWPIDTSDDPVLVCCWSHLKWAEWVATPPGWHTSRYSRINEGVNGVKQTRRGGQKMTSPWKFVQTYGFVKPLLPNFHCSKGFFVLATNFNLNKLKSCLDFCPKSRQNEQPQQARRSTPVLP